jgi:hypothetical protein
MPSTYSPDLRIELIANGEQSGIWGTTTNLNLGTLIEDAISGLASVSVIAADQALTASNGAADQARCAAVSLTTTTSANFNVYVPPVTKLYVVKNASSYVATVYCSTVIGNTTAAGTGVAIPAGKSVLLRADGTNIVEQLDYVVGNFGVGGNATVTGTTTFTGASTFGSTVTLNANPTLALQAATKQYVDSAAGGVIPTGVIVMWSGTIATIPSGWALCNGSGGTPDLRNRFIVGAHSDDSGVAKTTITGSPTQTGGSKDATVVSHTHTATVTDPGHTHQYKQTGNNTSTASFSRTGLSTVFSSADNLIATATTGISVGISTEGSSGTDANLVPYYALAYIMKL